MTDSQYLPTFRTHNFSLLRSQALERVARSDHSLCHHSVSASGYTRFSQGQIRVDRTQQSGTSWAARILREPLEQISCTYCGVQQFVGQHFSPRRTRTLYCMFPGALTTVCLLSSSQVPPSASPLSGIPVSLPYADFLFGSFCHRGLQTIIVNSYRDVILPAAMQRSTGYHFDNNFIYLSISIQGRQ